MRLSIWFALTTGILVFSVSTASVAVPIEVAFSGSIDSIDDPNGLLSGGVALGHSFSGSYLFDSEPVGAPSPSQPGQFFYTVSANSSISVAIGANSLSLGNSQGDLSIFIADDRSPSPGQPVLDPFDFWGTAFLPDNGILPIVSFFDTSLARISDPTEYFVNTSLAGWDFGILRIVNSDSCFDACEVLLTGEIESLRVVQAIPEPRATILFSLGLAVVASRRR